MLDLPCLELSCSPRELLSQKFWPDATEIASWTPLVERCFEVKVSNGNSQSRDGERLRASSSDPMESLQCRIRNVDLHWTGSCRKRSNFGELEITIRTCGLTSEHSSHTAHTTSWPLRVGGKANNRLERPFEPFNKRLISLMPCAVSQIFALRNDLVKRYRSRSTNG